MRPLKAVDFVVHVDVVVVVNVVVVTLLVVTGHILSTCGHINLRLLKASV